MTIISHHLRTVLRALIGLAALSLLAPVAAAADRIEISVQSDLLFGELIASPAGGTVTVDPLGMRLLSGVYSMATDSYGPARFQVRVIGTGNPHYDIILPTSFMVENERGSRMTVTELTSLPNGTGMVQPPAYLGELSIGGTLNVGGNQQGGAYVGYFPVVVQLVN